MLVPSGSTAQQFKWTGLSLTKFKARFDINYVNGVNSADHQIFTADVGATKIITLGMITTNKLRLYTAAGTGTTIWTSSTTLGANTHYRVECYMNGISATTATVKIALYAGHSTTPLETYDGTGISNTGTVNIDNFVYGKHNAVSTANSYVIDNVAFDDNPSSDYVWPSYTFVDPVTWDYAITQGI